MSRAADPDNVPFTYATGHGDIHVRPPGIVELSLTTERIVGSAEGDNGEEPVVCARLALPIGTAEALAAALSSVASHRPDKAAGSNEPAVGRNQLAAGLMGATLVTVVRALLAHLDPSVNASEVLSRIEAETIAHAKNAVFEGTDMDDEGPAVADVVKSLQQLFASWKDEPT